MHLLVEDGVVREDSLDGMPLLHKLDMAFCHAASDWVDCDMECEEGEDDDEEVVHEDGCGCNALISVAKYAEGSKQFQAALKDVVSYIYSIRNIIQQLDAERGRVYVKDEATREDYGYVLKLCSRMLGCDQYDHQREAEE